MLIQFAVANYRSIRSEQVFSLVATNNDDYLDNVAISQNPSIPNILKSTAIYGPNASGKTSLVRAMSTMKKIVVDSAAVDVIPVIPFRLDKFSSHEPTYFEIFFSSDDIKYQYGFSATSTRIHSEWLHAFPKGRRQKWFERSFTPETDEETWDFGANLKLSTLKSKRELLVGATKPRSLFLSTAAMLNDEQLKPLAFWFNTMFRVVGKGGVVRDYTCAICDEPENKSEVVKFLKNADLPIDDIRINKSKFDIEGLPSDMPEAFKNALAEQFEDKDLLEPKTVHRTSDGLEVEFDLDEESDGTRKLFDLAGPLLDVLKHGRVLVVDELHDSLHPKLTEHIVKLFNNKSTNPRNAQLIFTTHETSILDQDILRRDQFWFCEKNIENETEIFSLMEFSPRKGRENLEKSYLSGRYGALPYIPKNFEFQEEE